MKNITLADWKSFHPDIVETESSDYYYVKVANKLYDSWKFSLMYRELPNYLRLLITLQVTAYFEDIISGFCLWQSFTKNHKKRYGSYLPFYTIREGEYYTDEINLQDINFLIWSVMQRDMIDERIINPENPGIQDLAIRFYEILDNEFEKAPINTAFLDCIRKEDYFTDFFKFKELADWFYMDSYLLTNDSASIYEQQTDFDNEDYNCSRSQLLYAIRSNLIFNFKTGPLALPMKEWLSNWLEEIGMTEEAAVVKEIESVSNSLFQLISTDDTYLHIKDTKENTYKVLRSSLGEEHPKNRSELIASLVKFDNEWHVNGAAIWLSKGKYAEEKENEASLKEDFNIANEKLLKATNNYPLAYFKDEAELNQWLSKAFEINQASNNTSELKGKEGIVTFIESGKSLAVMPELAFLIKDERNPYYDQKKAKDQAISALIGNYPCSAKMVKFLLENNMLPDAMINSLQGEKRGLELVQNNKEFMARFFMLERW
ncbi:DUF3843 family protein [Bacteroides sp. 224]|uniref:DUF3843 family protein n=1 Tax=Bacteroides sp. 224 TaxID=2302936 RepID=UPI0013D0FBF6|nr:DUF3843 family protein [Bacteroides sp. 224]NDV64719.1 DUF3843 family protein [Bacteroides sp. 224]